MNAQLLHQAEAKLNEIIASYSLTRYFGTEEFSTTCGLALVAGSGHHLYIYDYGRWAQPRSVLPFQEGRTPDPIYSLGAVKTNEGPRIAVGTRLGKVSLVDPVGYVIWQIKAADASVWHVTTCEIDGQLLLFVCSMDMTVKIYDLRGQLRCTLRTPGRLLSIDVREIGGRILIAGGAQERNFIYLWDLQEALIKQRTTPTYILKGGRRPAFCTKLVELALEPCVLHGSWDGYCYLYRIEALQRRVLNAPEVVLRADGAVYPVVATELHDTPFVVAGTAQGSVQAWELEPSELKPRSEHVLACVSSRIRSLCAAKVLGQTKLFVGDSVKRIYGLTVDRLEENMRPEEELHTTEGGEIAGIALISDPR
jgi:hypothetical protein